MLTYEPYSPLSFLIYIALLIASILLLAWAVVRGHWPRVEALVIAVFMFAIGMMAQVTRLR